MAVTMDMAELAEARDVDLGVSDWLEGPDAVMGVDYGLDRLRLTAPVPSGSRVRARAHLTDTEPEGDTEPKGGGLRCRVEVTVEIEGQDRPALVATTLSLGYGG